MAVTIHTHKTAPTVAGSHQHSQVNRLRVAMAASLFLHVIVLFGMTFQFPQPKLDKIATSLEVVLVNNKTPTKPTKTELLAQDNLDGGGNTDDNRRAKTPFPVLPKSKPLTRKPTTSKPTNKPVTDDIAMQQKVKQLEQEAKKLMTAVDETKQAQQLSTLPDEAEDEDEDTAPDAADLLLRSLDIARLRAQIDQDHDDYQKRPKRKFVGARTKEYRFARYVEDWRIKVERIGNLNYPEAARKGKLYGNLQLTVSIRANGSLEAIEIHRSSGEKILDEAAINIVKLAGQNGFAPFPPDISKDTDILHITRTWVFAPSDMLLSQ
ncbi:protein TonB [Nitrosomonas sp. Nm84]|uniref:energy transducer TonB n=1 Tax=Nitrosomonas sp. Nm84 TaxID=200124 RepID=UPI000D8302ED|nr:energy transducer TonB [Nitrosomonas sp. Nm84]PXW86804.1 protein TonB [Nitrosomonas sp. Nm84]